MRISDWSSDVCSSDLFLLERHEADELDCGRREARLVVVRHLRFADGGMAVEGALPAPGCGKRALRPAGGDRKSVVEGKSVSVRVDLGGRRIIKKKIKQQNHSDL